jgi:hypothetical protein
LLSYQPGEEGVKEDRADPLRTPCCARRVPSFLPESRRATRRVGEFVRRRALDVDDDLPRGRSSKGITA